MELGRGLCKGKEEESGVSLHTLILRSLPVRDINGVGHKN